MSFRCSISRNEVEVLYHKGGLETDESTEIIFVSVKVGIKPAGNKMFKVNNRNSRTRCEICSKLTIKDAIGVVQISLLLTLNIFHTLLYCFYC